MDLGRELVIALVERGANLLEHVGSAIKGNQGKSREMKGNQGRSHLQRPRACAVARHLGNLKEELLGLAQRRLVAVIGLHTSDAILR